MYFTCPLFPGEYPRMKHLNFYENILIVAVWLWGLEEPGIEPTLHGGIEAWKGYTYWHRLHSHQVVGVTVKLILYHRRLRLVIPQKDFTKGLKFQWNCFLTNFWGISYIIDRSIFFISVSYILVALSWIFGCFLQLKEVTSEWTMEVHS